MRRAFLLIVLLCFAQPALAQTTKPVEIADAIQASAPYGQGSYSWMGLKVYDASLWTDASSWSMQEPFALTLHYNMHFTAQQLAERSIEEMRHAEPLSADQATAYSAQLKAAFHEVQKGDEITALYTPHKGATLFYNGTPNGMVSDDALAQRFLNIWLSEKTSAPDMRQQLLGHNK